LAGLGGLEGPVEYTVTLPAATTTLAGLNVQQTFTQPNTFTSILTNRIGPYNPPGPSTYMAIGDYASSGNYNLIKIWDDNNEITIQSPSGIINLNSPTVSINSGSTSGSVSLPNGAMIGDAYNTGYGIDLKAPAGALGYAELVSNNLYSFVSVDNNEVAIGTPGYQWTFDNTGTISSLNGGRIRGITNGIFINNLSVTGGVTFANIYASNIVNSWNGLTGAVTGVTAINAGTGISITGTTNPTISVDTSTIAISVFKVMSGATGNNLKYLHCDYCTGGTISASAATNTLVYYLPFTVGGPGNVLVKAAVQSAATSPGASPGTITAKIYGASSSTGNPSGSSLYDLGTITLTNTTNAAFIGDTTVSLPPGHYWIGYKFSAIPILRRLQIDQGASYRTVGGEVQSGTNYIFSYFSETVSSGSTAPSTVGTVSETNSTSLNTVVPAIYLQVQ
jgi:hypothetical protein